MARRLRISSPDRAHPAWSFLARGFVRCADKHPCPQPSFLGAAIMPEFLRLMGPPTGFALRIGWPQKRHMSYLLFTASFLRSSYAPIQVSLYESLVPIRRVRQRSCEQVKIV